MIMEEEKQVMRIVKMSKEVRQALRKLLLEDRCRLSHQEVRLVRRKARWGVDSEV